VLNLADNDIKAKHIHQHALSHAIGLSGHSCDECGQSCTEAYRCGECDYDCCVACNTSGCPVIALADAIKNNGAMTSLNLASNSINPQGAKHIAGALKVSKYIPAVILVPPCPSDHYLHCWCLLLSAGHGGVDQARHQQQQYRAGRGPSADH
jgi:hypothetical protein